MLSFINRFLLEYADLDECSTGQYSCPRGSRCENTDGSYKCLIRCSPGQKLGANGQCRRKCFNQTSVFLPWLTLPKFFSLVT